MYEELPSEKLRRVCDPSILPCEKTEEMAPLEGIIGQERAVRAMAEKMREFMAFPIEEKKRVINRIQTSKSSVSILLFSGVVASA